jgi:transcription antitermination factor NusA-like protein
MYFELDVETELHVLARTMAAQFGRKNCKVVDTEIKIGAKTLKGKRINVEMAGQKLSVDLLEIEMSDSKSSFIAFQDVKDEDGEASAESEDVINMVDDTIEYH